MALFGVQLDLAQVRQIEPRVAGSGVRQIEGGGCLSLAIGCTQRDLVHIGQHQRNIRAGEGSAVGRQGNLLTSRWRSCRRSLAAARLPWHRCRY
jgi:hypothetical protein